jgi:hypothetical protein
MAVACAFSSARAFGAESSPDRSAETRAEAQRTFNGAQQLYDAGKTEAALEAFKSSYAAFPSPNSRLYAARCLRDLGRNAEAYLEYTAVLQEAAEAEDADRYTMTLEAASVERAALRTRIGMVRLTVPEEIPGLEVRVGDRVVTAANSGQPIPAEVGTVTVTAVAPNRQPFSRKFELAAGERRAVAVELAPADTTSSGTVPAVKEPPEPPAPTWPVWRAVAVGSAGVAVVGFAVWGAFGLQARARYDRLRRECDGHCGSEFQDSIDAGRTETLISEVGLGAGAVGVAGSVLGFLLDSGQTRITATPAVGLGRSRFEVAWGGRF